MRRLALAVLIAGASCAAAAAAAPSARSDARGSESVYRAKARRELDAFKKKIDALEVRARGVEAAARERMQADVKALRAKQAEAEAAFGKFESAAAAERRGLRERIDRLLRELDAAYKKAVAPRKTGKAAP